MSRVACWSALLWPTRWLAVGLAVLGTARGALGTVLVEFPTAVNDGAPAIGVPGDFAPGFEGSSWRANGTSYSKLPLTPNALFGHGITIGDLESISYWTKKDTLQGSVDWFLQIYTIKETGDPGSWYGYRINSEPYFSQNLNAPVGQWNQWTSDGTTTTNKLRFYDSTSGYFGGYNDGFLSDIQTSFSSKGILLLGIGTGSGWASGFTGQVDGLRIKLKNGEVANVNLEAIPEPASLLVWTLVGGVGMIVAARRRNKIA